MNALIRFGRLLLAFAGATFALALFRDPSLFFIAQADPEEGLVLVLLGRTLLVSVPLVAAGLLLAAWQLRLWAIPLAAAVWSTAIVSIIDPTVFDAAIEWFLRL